MYVCKANPCYKEQTNWKSLVSQKAGWQRSFVKHDLCIFFCYFLLPVPIIFKVAYHGNTFLLLLFFQSVDGKLPCMIFIYLRCICANSVEQ